MKKFQQLVYALIAIVLLPIAYQAVEKGQAVVATVTVFALITLVMALNNTDFILKAHTKNGASMTLETKTRPTKKTNAKKK